MVNGSIFYCFLLMLKFVSLVLLTAYIYVMVDAALKKWI